ncbi:MAG TPA: right-handed parallel beta-helix repeat-containing protein [Candidatus Polarisedimenticolaceae bacterium]|nr:right-handed parallel beta-helix repeat-containing protein [Candidatus Polarisedimenticolaceae bacterium]
MLAWMLATAVALTAPGNHVTPQLDVDCQSERALDRALARAARLGGVDLVLHGVCRGHFVIKTPGITLRGATAESGLGAPEGDDRNDPVLEIVNVEASLRNLAVEGGTIGVQVRGFDSEVLLFGVDVRGQQNGVGVWAQRGGRIRILDSNIHDGYTGIAADSDSNVNLQRVVVSGQNTGVYVAGGSFAALNDSTIENNREAGLSVGGRSDVNILGGTFRENGQIHVAVSDWSGVSLVTPVTLGSDTDATPNALGASRGSVIQSYSTPEIHGDAVALDGGALRLGNAVLHGNLIVFVFANATVRDGEITGSVFCFDGSDAICSSVTSGGAFGCPSPTCEDATAGTAAPVPPLPQVPRPRSTPLQR